MRKSLYNDLQTVSGARSTDEVRKLCLAHKNMLDRCYNPNNASFGNYGGRGIAVCKEWRADRLAFLQWAVRNGHGMSLWLDRVDNNAGYSPSNCRWATVKQQLRNQRRNHRITHNGRTQTAAEWAEELGVGLDALYRRLNVYRMPAAKALTAGSLHTWKHGTRAGYEGHKCRCTLCKASNARRGVRQRATRKLRAAA